MESLTKSSKDSVVVSRSSPICVTWLGIVRHLGSCLEASPLRSSNNGYRCISLRFEPFEKSRTSIGLIFAKSLMFGLSPPLSEFLHDPFESTECCCSSSKKGRFLIFGEKLSNL